MCMPAVWLPQVGRIPDSSSLHVYLMRLKVSSLLAIRVQHSVHQAPDDSPCRCYRSMGGTSSLLWQHSSAQAWLSAKRSRVRISCPPCMPAAPAHLTLDCACAVQCMGYFHVRGGQPQKTCDPKKNLKHCTHTRCISGVARLMGSQMDSQQLGKLVWARNHSKGKGMPIWWPGQALDPFNMPPGVQITHEQVRASQQARLWAPGAQHRGHLLPFRWAC
jgi:hypothetical protein